MSKLATCEERIAVGERLAAVRRQLGLSQSEFALSLALSPRAYANYERGEREAPGAVLKAIWEQYGIDPLWLMCGPGAVPQKASGRTIDGALLQATLTEVKTYLAATGRRLSPAQEAQVIKVLYALALEHGSLSAAGVAGVVDIAAGGHGR